MPQIKDQVSRVGGLPLFQGDAIRFVRNWREPITVPIGSIALISCLAAKPELARPFAENFARLYVQAPDFVSSLLNRLRSKWRKLETSKSKAGRIKAFLALTVNMKPAGARRPKDQWSLADGELATGFQDWSSSVYGKAMSVGIGDVRQARLWVSAQIREGEKLAARFLNGGKCFESRRRNKRRKV